LGKYREVKWLLYIVMSEKAAMKWYMWV
jgi:hypothetical protein